VADTWLAVGEGLIGFVVGVLVGAVYVLVRVVAPKGPPCDHDRPKGPPAGPI
jgi:hypothetical protein